MRGTEIDPRAGVTPRVWNVADPLDTENLIEAYKFLAWYTTRWRAAVARYFESANCGLWVVSNR
ncbi:MAG: hypothetical protein L0H63_00865 [Nitrococcus sp.]|nr:hypothetical protein [Nitrococcus sp.]